LYQILQFQ